MKQSTLKKYVECAFGLLKKNQHTSHPWPVLLSGTLGLIMRACIILHNIIINDKRDISYDDNYHTITSIVVPPVNYETPASVTSILQRETRLTSELMFLNLQ
jgi:hypothetical protein